MTNGKPKNIGPEGGFKVKIKTGYIASGPTWHSTNYLAFNEIGTSPERLLNNVDWVLEVNATGGVVLNQYPHGGGQKWLLENNYLRLANSNPARYLHVDASDTLTSKEGSGEHTVTFEPIR